MDYADHPGDEYTGNFESAWQNALAGCHGLPDVCRIMRGAVPLFGRRKRLTEMPYDKSGKIPVIRSSICTGEQVAGFKDSSGKFEELMLIRDDKDLSEFLSRYQVEKTEIKREW